MTNRQKYASTFMELQRIGREADKTASAPPSLAALCQVLQQSLDEEDDEFGEGDFKILFAAANVNAEVSQIVAGYRLELATA